MIHQSRKILITGAGGYVAKELIRQMLIYTNNLIVTVSSDKNKVREELSDLHCDERITCFSREEALDNTIPWTTIDIVVHLAFARKQFPQNELVESLIFSKKVFQQVLNTKVPALINVSSQSIYGSAPGLHREDSFPCPLDFYSLSKCANEIILDAVFYNTRATKVTNIRLDSIAGNKNLIPSLVRQGIEDRTRYFLCWMYEMLHLAFWQCAEAILQSGNLHII